MLILSIGPFLYLLPYPIETDEQNERRFDLIKKSVKPDDLFLRYPLKHIQ